VPATEPMFKDQDMKASWKPHEPMGRLNLMKVVSVEPLR
jgi:hypothetical protein